MIFVNMLDDAGCKTYRTEKQGAIPFVVKDSGIVENVNIGLTKNNTLEVVQGNQGLFGKGLTGDDKEIYLADKLPSKVNSKLTFAQVKETEDNPLIIVLCKSIEVFDGVPANIQYMYIGEDAILACLIYGVCAFDGVPMRRCNTQDTQGKASRVYNGKDILSLHDFKDKQSGYNYMWDVVCQTQINFSSTLSSTSYRTIQDCINFITVEKLNAYRKKMEEIRAKQEAEKERIKAEREAMRLELLRKRKEEEEKAKEMMLTKTSNKKEKVQTQTRLVGASVFLQAVKESQANKK